MNERLRLFASKTSSATPAIHVTIVFLYKLFIRNLSFCSKRCYCLTSTMASKQYDVSEEIQKLFHLKQKRLAETKSYFRRIMQNPHRPVDDPVPFDPVLHRFSSLKSYSVEHYRATPKRVGLFLAYAVIPVALIYAIVKWENETRNSKIRAGLVRYEDRRYRLLM